MTYYKTHILKNLIHKKILADRLRFLFKEDASELEAFLRDVYFNGPSEKNVKIKKYVPLLIKHGYISNRDSNKLGRSSLMGVKAVNFELTYNCSYSCSHCLQKNIRKNQVTEPSTENVKDAILQAYLSGLCTAGINFTGGEVLGNRYDLFEILRFTQSLKIAYRLNSNSWWAGEDPLNICGITFNSAVELVRNLKSMGLYQFAFSYDGRLDNPERMKNLIGSIRSCEKAGVFYQLLFTGIASTEINGKLNEIQKEIGQPLFYVIPVSMEMVDIGGASDLSSEIFNGQSNLSTCGTKGFYHPQLLHVSPDGKVRTCMYAIGSSNVGDLSQKSWAELLNEFPESKTGEIFSSQDKYNLSYETLVKPYLSLYKPVRHGCTKNAILAKTLEIYSRGHQPNLEAIHKTIAEELNLTGGKG